MEKNDTGPLTIAEYEQEMLAILVDTTARLSEEVEKRLPHDVRDEYRILSKYSHTPWTTLYWSLKLQSPLYGDTRQTLLLRATLEDIGEKLHVVAHTIAENNN